MIHTTEAYYRGMTHTTEVDIDNIERHLVVINKNPLTFLDSSFCLQRLKLSSSTRKTDWK